MKRGRRQQPSRDAALVLYPEIRDRFLARMGASDSERLESYVAIGRFVYDRWAAEELDRVDGQPLDEQLSWGRWDQCTEKHLRDLRTEAVTMLQAEMKQKRMQSFIADWARQWEPIRGMANGFAWFVTEALRGFVGGVGLLIFGLLIAWLAPGVARSVRSAVDDTLPEKTRPTTVDNGAPTASSARAQ